VSWRTQLKQGEWILLVRVKNGFPPVMKYSRRIRDTACVDNSYIISMVMSLMVELV